MPGISPPSPSHSRPQLAASAAPSQRGGPGRLLERLLGGGATGLVASPDFLPGVLNRDAADEILQISDEDAIGTSRALATREGIFCGISAGATVAAALRAAESAPEGSEIVAMIPDTGERYMSTPLFEGITEESDDEWLAAQG